MFVQYTQIESVGVSGGVNAMSIGTKGKMVLIEMDVIPFDLSVTMHLVKETWFVFPCRLAGYITIPVVHSAGVSFQARRRTQRTVV